MNTIHEGNITKLTSASAINRELRAQTYDINVTMAGFELHHRRPFQMPEKIYGGYDTFALRVLKTFSQLKKGMAVLLSGPKGSGKTLTAKQIAIMSEMPVLCITSQLTGSNFNAFLTEIPNPCVIFIDEFEKVYNDRESRNWFLSLLDGASDNKHLFVMTSNSDDIGEYFANRPGRVRYHKKYTSLDDKILMEMIDDNMPQGRLKKAVVKLIQEKGGLSPDALMSLITECMMHNEVPADFMEYFNIQTELTGWYDVIIDTKGLRPKPKITKKQLEQAESYIQAFNDESLAYARSYYSEGEKYTVEVNEQYSAKMTKPFKGTQHQSNPGDLFVEVNFAEKANSTKQTRRFNILHREVKSMKFDNGIIVLETKNNQVFRFQKTSSRAYVD